MAKRGLVFCVAGEAWPAAWLDGVRASGLECGQVLVLADARIDAPDRPDLLVVAEGEDIPPDATLVLLRHAAEASWHRAAALVAAHAARARVGKLVYLAHDAYLVSARAAACVNALDAGWTGFWCPALGGADPSIQVLVGAAIGALAEFVTADDPARPLPFTLVKRDLIGDRYHAYQDFIPRDADFATSVKLAPRARQLHLWWLAGHGLDAAEELAALYMRQDYASIGDRHPGPFYFDFFEAMGRILRPRSYFEIGTKEGYSLARFGCDAVCVDPDFALSYDALQKRTRTHFYQQTSDAFFAENDIRDFFRQGVDVAFLDGLHLYEFLLRDFINTERSCHARSVIVMHDCLPLNERMAERTQRWDSSEPDEIHDWWTGDVWKVLLILAKYRPDLRIHCIDCPPTGLVVVTGLNPQDRRLAAQYQEIEAEFRCVELSDIGIPAIWNLFPTLDSVAILRSPLDFAALFSPA